MGRQHLNKVRSFFSDQRGNMAVIFGIALVPLFGLVGATVDYSRAGSYATSLQAATDATALALSKNAATLSNDDLQTKANGLFGALFNRPEVKNLAVTATYTKSPGSKIVVDASGIVGTDFMGLFGHTSIGIGATSQAEWGNTKLRVALVLDTTGSMSASGKMSALQTAAKNLLTQLQNAAAQDGDVYVSIVPFSENVNVGSSNSGASWIDWTDWEAPPALLTSWIPNNQSSWDQTGPGDSCPFTNGSVGFRCAPSPTSTSTVSTVPSSGTSRGYVCPSVDTGGRDSTKVGVMYNGCYNSVSATRTIDSGSNASCGSANSCSCSGSGRSRACTQSYYTHSWIKNARSTWNGCITDRGGSTNPSGDYDRSTAAPSGSVTASLFPAQQSSYCPAQVKALSYNWTTMKSAVDGLYPSGATNQPIGLVHGWQSLVGGGPYPAAPAKDPNYQYNTVIILMSDGLNTLDRWYGDGSTTNTSVDQRMYQNSTTGTCANIKAAEITIYTVQVDTGGDPTSTLLQNCASSSDKFWLVTSSGALNTVFNQIGTELANLRIAK